MMSPNSRATLDIASAEDHGLRAAWAAAALREYRCHARYISLLALEAAGELELRFAWLEWWTPLACVGKRCFVSKQHKFDGALCWRGCGGELIGALHVNPCLNAS